MIKPDCIFELSKLCEGELTHFGAILFSPPNNNFVKKDHVCVECYKELEKLKKVK